MHQEFKFQGQSGPITIIPISTGTVSMKTKAHTARFNNFGLRLIDIIRDNRFTDDLPVYTWLIRHPEGLFLIDTGYSHQINQPDYFKKAAPIEKWFSRTQVTTRVDRPDELVHQLAEIGIRLSDIHSVILTHLHVDHVGGIPDMRGLRYIVNAEEVEHNSHAFLLPKWFAPEKVTFPQQGVGAFPRSIPLTQRGDMHFVATPGHTRGHSSILLQTRNVDILFAGDLVYSAQQLTDHTTSAPNEVKSSRLTYQMVESYARNSPLIVLPSHDAQALDRLRNHETISFR